MSIILATLAALACYLLYLAFKYAAREDRTFRDIQRRIIELESKNGENTNDDTANRE